MLNKPKYSIFKNTKYALDGFLSAIKHETSFRIEIFYIIIMLLFIFIFYFSLENKFKLIFTGFFILIVELINSSIETTVDLVTKEKNNLAKIAKDTAASAVMISILLHILTWFLVFQETFR